MMQQQEIKRTAGVREMAKAKKRMGILRAALELFSSCGIENVSMEQVSAKAGIGSATIYRYFPAKAELAAGAALLLWKDMEQQYLPSLMTEAFSSLNGREQLREILLLFPAIYEEHPSFLRFLMDFDNYIQSSGMAKTQLSDYEGLIGSLKGYAEAAIEKGLSDHTLFFTVSVEEIYFTVFHCMLSTTQKIAVQGDLLTMDLQVPGKTQLDLLITLLMKGLSK